MRVSPFCCHWAVQTIASRILVFLPKIVRKYYNVEKEVWKIKTMQNFVNLETDTEIWQIILHLFTSDKHDALWIIYKNLFSICCLIEI